MSRNQKLFTLLIAVVAAPAATAAVPRPIAAPSIPEAIGGAVDAGT